VRQSPSPPALRKQPASAKHPTAFSLPSRPRFTNLVGPRTLPAIIVDARKDSRWPFCFLTTLPRYSFRLTTHYHYHYHYHPAAACTSPSPSAASPRLIISQALATTCPLPSKPVAQRERGPTARPPAARCRLVSRIEILLTGQSAAALPCLVLLQQHRHACMPLRVTPLSTVAFAHGQLL
jgi:hypothetical protein